MTLGFDAYAPADSALARRAVAAGFQFQGCYYGSGAKVLTAEKALVLANAGLSIVSYFETTALRALQGASAGKADAQLAIQQAVAAGQPRGTPIYFACDTDVDMSQGTSRNAVFGYYTAARVVLVSDGRFSPGAYGSGDLCLALLAAGLVTHTVEAGAEGWHGTSTFEGWTIKQHPEIRAQDSVLGVAYDPLECRGLDEAGAWRPMGMPVPTPEPIPHQLPDPIAHILAAQSFDAGVRAFQVQNGLHPVDGVVGPITLRKIGELS